MGHHSAFVRACKGCYSLIYVPGIHPAIPVSPEHAGRGPHVIRLQAARFRVSRALQARPRIHAWLYGTLRTAPQPSGGGGAAARCSNCLQPRLNLSDDERQVLDIFPDLTKRKLERVVKRSLSCGAGQNAQIDQGSHRPGASSVQTDGGRRAGEAAVEGVLLVFECCCQLLLHLLRGLHVLLGFRAAPALPTLACCDLSAPCLQPCSCLLTHSTPPSCCSGWRIVSLPTLTARRMRPTFMRIPFRASCAWSRRQR